jgi:hypothetical protein
VNCFLRFVKSRFRGSGWARVFVDAVDGLLQSGGHGVNIFEKWYEGLRGVERGIRSTSFNLRGRPSFRGRVLEL